MWLTPDWIGNDVVDLAEVPPLEQCLRRLRRTGSREEWLLLGGEQDGRRAFARLWAIKESVYKASVQRWGRHPFSPPAIQVQSAKLVLFQGESFVVELTEESPWVHAVTSSRPFHRGVEPIAPPLTESLSARRLGEQLAKEAGWELGRVVEPAHRRAPPRLQTTQGEFPLSLSHDGRFAAAAVPRCP